MIIKRMVCIAMLVALSAVFLSGCWDQKDLQERGIVLAAAIDVAERDDTVTPDQPAKYRLTVQLLKPNGMERSEKGRKQSGKTLVLSGTGFSIFDIIRSMLAQHSLTLWWEYLQVIVISKEAIELHGVKPVLDFFIRDPEMRWRIKVFVTEQKARKFIEYEPLSGQPSGTHYYRMAEQNKKNPYIPGGKTELGYISNMLDSDQSVNIPRLYFNSEGRPQVGGVMIFRGAQLRGELSEYGVRGVRLINGLVKSGVITFEYPKGAGNNVTLEIFETRTKLYPAYIDEQRILFNYDLYVRTNIGEIQQLDGKLDIKEPQTLRALEIAAAQAITDNVMYSFRECQQMQEDVLRFNKKLKAYKPKEWERLRENGNEYLEKVELNPAVNVIIKNRSEHL